MTKAFGDLEENDKQVLMAIYHNSNLSQFALRHRFPSGAAVRRRFHEIWEQELDPENLLRDPRTRIALWELWEEEDLDLYELAVSGLPDKHLHCVGPRRKQTMRVFLAWFALHYRPQELMAIVLAQTQETLELAQATWKLIPEKERGPFRRELDALAGGFGSFFMPPQWVHR